MAKREKRALGDFFKLNNFGVNLTLIEPDGESSLLHRHRLQDEFVFIVEGIATLVTDEGEMTLGPGMCAGFRAGGRAHHLVNRSDGNVLYLEVGDRTKGDAGDYPKDDLQAVQDSDGGWVFLHKDGSAYPD
jgi:uncharacterized cupin superfamily protein